MHVRDDRGEERDDPERRDARHSRRGRIPVAAEATPSAGARTTQTGPVAELGLVAAGLGLVIYLIAFVADLGGSTSLVLPLLLGGGLLAGTVALPTVGGRVLAPAAVVTTTGALLLLRAVVDDGSALAVGALVLGLLEAGAAVGATLMQAGVMRSRPPKARKRRASAFSGYPAGPQFPGQQYPGQPYPGTYARRCPGGGAVSRRPVDGRARLRPERAVRGAVRRARLPAAPAVRDTRLRPRPARLGGPTVAVGSRGAGDTASPPRGTRPVTEPVAGSRSRLRVPVHPGPGYGHGRAPRDSRPGRGRIPHRRRYRYGRPPGRPGPGGVRDRVVPDRVPVRRPGGHGLAPASGRSFRPRRTPPRWRALIRTVRGRPTARPTTTSTPGPSRPCGTTSA